MRPTSYLWVTAFGERARRAARQGVDEICACRAALLVLIDAYHVRLWFCRIGSVRIDDVGHAVTGCTVVASGILLLAAG